MADRKLKTEREDYDQEEIESCARAVLGEERDLCAHFEHGQWWITEPDTGAAWSVVDAVGGRSVGGFDFEQVSEGDRG
jgi:hypothetical protein